MNVRCWLIAASFVGSALARGDTAADPLLPPTGFSGERYAPLWEKSPFALATPDVTASASYQLVGLAQFDGISYASLVDKQTQEHFVVSSTAPAHDLELISISRNAQGASVVLEHRGERLVLSEMPAPGSPATPRFVAPPAFSSSPVEARSQAAPGTFLPPGLRARQHRPTIVVPLPPANSP